MTVHRSAARHPPRHHIPDQSPLPRSVLADRGRRLAHTGVGGQRGLHLAEFDAVAAYLDLAVGPSDKDQFAVAGPAHDVAGAVHPPPAFGRGDPHDGRERAGHEPLRGQRRPSLVAARQALPRHVQFPGHAGRHRLEERVQDVQPGVGDGTAYGGRLAAGQRGGGRLHDGGFGDAVLLVELPSRGPAPAQLLGQRLAAGHDDAQVGQVVRRQVQQEGRGAAELGDPVGAQQAGQVGAQGRRARRGQDEASARAQYGPGVGDRHVEGGGGELEDAAVRADAEPGHPVGDEVAQTAVGDRDAFRYAGGPRGVDEVRRVVRSQRRTALRLGHEAAFAACQGPGHGRVVQVGHVGGAVAGHRVPGVGGAQHHGGVRVPQQEGPARGRVVRVDGYEDAARHEHGQCGGQGLRRAPQHHRDAALRADAEVDQVTGQTAGRGREFPVGHGPAGVLDGHGVARPRRAAAEQFRYQYGGQRHLRTVPLRHHPPAFFRVQHADPPHGGRRTVGDQLFEDQGQPGGQGFDDVGGEQSALVDEVDAELFAGGDVQAQRVVDDVGHVREADRERAGPVRGGRWPGQVLVDHDAVEERAGSAQFLRLGQAEVPVGQEGRLAFLYVLEQGGHRLRGVQRHPYRQRVDQEAHHRLDARQFGRAVGHGDAEDHVRTAGQPGEDQCPGTEYHGARGQAVGAGQFRHPAGQLGGEAGVQVYGVGRAVLRCRRRHQGGFARAVERGAPGLPCGVLVLPRQPGQVLPVRGDGGRPRVVAARFVRRGQLRDQHRQRPAVHQDVVGEDDQVVAVRAEADQQEPPQRRRRQVDPPALFPCGQLRGRGRRRVLREVRDVRLVPGQRHVTRDDLHGRAGRAPAEARPEGGVPVHQGPPGGP